MSAGREIRDDGELHTVRSTSSHNTEFITDTSPASVVPYQGFPTADGTIFIGGANDRLFGILCEKLGQPWAQDPRFATNNARVENRSILEPLIEAETRKRTTKEWLKIFEGSGMPYAAVNDIMDTLNHEHGKSPPPPSWKGDETDCSFYLAKARNMVQTIDHPVCGPLKVLSPPVKYSNAEPSIRSPPPLLGEHTDEVLQEVVGLSGERVKELKEKGVVA